MSGRIDVLMCVGAADVARLMPYAIRSCLKHFEPLARIVIATNAARAVRESLKQHGLPNSSASITIVEDEAVLPPGTDGLSGWHRQQIIRLHADQICETPIVGCLSADTILCRPITRGDLFEGDTPILFYNRYDYESGHLEYERTRVRNLAKLLHVTPERSLPLGDFIMDLMLLEGARLSALRAYLEALYGPAPWQRIAPARAETLDDRVQFGEWTLYAVFLLDVLGTDMPTRNSANRFIAQVHSPREFARFHFDAHAVHFVDKSFELSAIHPWLRKWGLV